MRQQLPPAHYLRQVIERLERVSRMMNPLLFFVAVSLVVLNLACVVNLIDWRSPPQASGRSAAASSTGTSSWDVTPPPHAAAAEPSRGAVTARD